MREATVGDAAVVTCRGVARVEVGVVGGGSLGQLVQLVVLLGVDTLMLLEILRTLERLATNRARVGLERGVDWGGSATRPPCCAYVRIISEGRVRVATSGYAMTRVLTTQMGRDVVTLDALDTATLPTTGQAEVVGRLAANVCLTQVCVQILGTWGRVRAVLPLAPYALVLHGLLDGGGTLWDVGVKLVTLLDLGGGGAGERGHRRVGGEGVDGGGRVRGRRARRRVQVLVCR